MLSGPPSERRRVRVAVVGCGSWATEAHLPTVAAHPQAELVGVADPLPAAREAAARFGAPAYARHEQLLAERSPDAVIVATPHATHHPVARDALTAGAHVLVEKPLVLRPAHGRELLELARRQGRELVVGYPWHYNRHALAVRDAVRAGRLGPLELVTCVFASTVREYYRGDTEAYQPALRLARAPLPSTYADPALAGGGQGQTQLTHAVALALLVSGLAPARVCGLTARGGLAVDLVDAVTVAFAGGALGTFASTGGHVPGHGDLLELRLFGRDGYALLDLGRGTAVLGAPGGGVDELPPLAPAERYPLAAPAANLVELVLGDAPNGSPGSLGQRAVEVVDGLYRSAAAGGAPVVVGEAG